MKIVLDSNILFSALIKNSITRNLILDYSDLFLFPEYIFNEANKYKSYLLKKSGMTEQEFNFTLDILLKKTLIVKNEVLLKYKKESIEILENIDQNDVMFIACALAYKDSVLWSDDKALKKQTKVKVLSTKEIIELFKK